MEMLETHAPGASMRVVHSQSHASWVQDPSDSNSSGMSTSISSSRRSVLSTSSSSTRVTSFRQWSSNFAQNSTNNAGVTQETRPTVTEFGNLKLALNPLDVSFLRTKGNVGRSGSIGSRRPPSRGRRLSTDGPSDSSAGEEHSKTPSPIPKGEGTVRAHDIAQENRQEKSEESSQEVIESEWTPSSSKTNLEADEKSKFALRLQTVLHRKRSVSSEDVRTGEGTDEEDASPEDTEGKWRRGASVRRSLPSSEWKSVVAAADDTRQRLRPRDPFKSSSVPALGGISSRRESFVTAESLREMKGRLKHRGSATDSIGGSTTSDIPPKNGEATQEDDDDSTKSRPAPFFLRVASKEAIPGTKQLQEAQDDRRKSWSVGCRNFAKRSYEEENEGMLNRRRSYAFEFAAEENGSTEDKENTTVGRTLQDGRGDAQREKLWVDTHPYVQNRVNEVLKKWSVIGKEEETKEKEELSRTSEKSPMASRRVYEERKGDSPVKSSTTWLENGDFQTDSPEIEEAEFSQATTTCGGRTSFRVNTSKSPFYKDEMISSSQEKQESSFSISGEPMEEYMSTHGLRPIEWTDEDAKASIEPEKNEVVPATAGISVTFSNTDGESNSRHHYSVTHLDSREAELMKMEGSKVRTSKKVEFSKTEVHFAAESGRFHIVETAGKPPPSNNFRRRRRSPTGAMNVDNGRVGLGSQSAITNGMRFGDSPYEMRLLAGSENLDSFRNSEDEFANGEVDKEDNRVDGEGSLEYKLVPSSHTKTFNDLVIEDERDPKEIIRKISETETLASTSTTFLQLGSEEQSEKPRSILRNSLTENIPPWKITVKGSDESENEDSKPKFGGVRLRPVASSLGHLRVNVTNNDSQEQLHASSTDKDYSCALSPGQMELQKLLRSLRRVSMTYSDSPPDSNTAVAQVANGGGMEVRISSASSQPSGTNTVIIGGDSEASAPLSVAQRVREVEERRQKELMNKVSAVQKPAPRASGQFSTRVTLGSTSSSVVSMESQVQRKTSVSQIENTNPVSPKPAEKLSTQNNKIARIHNAQGITSRLSGDGQQHSQVAATSDIKISTRMTENHTKLDQSKEVPMVTCISLGFQNKLKDGLKHAETRDEAKEKSEPSKMSGSKIDDLSAENPKRITAKVSERKVEGREKSPEVELHSRMEKYCVSSSSKDMNTAWHRVDLKNKEQDDHAKMGTSVQDIRSPKRGKELSLDNKPNAKQSVESLSSPIAVNTSFQSDVTSFQKFKEESRVDDVAGQFSVKMKVVKNQVEEKSGAISDPPFQSNMKSSTQSEYLHQRKTNTLTTSSKFTENESNAQRSKKESSPRVSREPRALAMQASKSPVMEQKSKVLTRGSKSGNPETSSPSSGRVVRKRLRKRGSGSTSKSLSSSDGKKQTIDDESAILEELTKAADEILHAVNGYSDEGSSDEDVEASKSESRTKRRQVSRKDVCSRKLSSSSSKDPKGGSLRNSSQRIKESRSRVTNGATLSSAEVMQRIVAEPQTSGTEASKTSQRMNLSSPVSSPNLHARGSSKAVLSEKSSKSKQHSPLPIPKKSMTRIEPTTRVAEVKLIEKRPPLPPAGQRRPSGTKERSEVLGRGSHGKVKTTTSLVYNKDGEAEIMKETKRPLNIARALEAVMPESRTKTKKIDQKVEVSSALKVSEIQKRVNPTSTSSSAQSSPSATLSIK
ncbi:hypothetical protein J437_LFUL008666 [Ladona fulva]|uniref:Uncharacterized protein n=1 Tax=Ladona fulva TaxID=123851 RepID=A0A8K0P112_LADFU|nr:hypothetical protein J437_LFUL008666 [Ladona fulva]